MAVPITTYVNVNVALEGTGVQPAGFGSPIIVDQTTFGSPARVLGPYASLADLVTAGAASTDAVYLAASAMLSQSPTITQFYVGRRDAGDADLTASLNAIEAENGNVFYGVLMTSRDDQDILDMAAWVETRSKIALVQSDSDALLNGTGRQYDLTFGGTETDGDYEITFTGFGLVAPVAVTLTRAGGVPATSDDLAAAFDAELDTQNGVAGDIEGILANVTSSGPVVSFSASRSVAEGTIAVTAVTGPATLVVATTDEDVARQLFDTQYTRTAIVYHDSDVEYKDAAWMARCFAFDLDQKKGIWAYKTLNGISGNDLTTAQANAIRSVNANYFSPIVTTFGTLTQSYTAQGFLPFGSAGAGCGARSVSEAGWSPRLATCCTTA